MRLLTSVYRPDIRVRNTEFILYRITFGLAFFSLSLLLQSLMDRLKQNICVIFVFCNLAILNVETLRTFTGPLPQALCELHSISRLVGEIASGMTLAQILSFKLIFSALFRNVGLIDDSFTHVFLTAQTALFCGECQS